MNKTESELVEVPATPESEDGRRTSRSSGGAIDGLRARVSWELLLALAVQAVFLAHALKVYFYDDDITNRQFPGQLANDRMSFLSQGWHTFDFWWHSAGRFFPLSYFITAPQPIIIHDAQTYKALLLLWTVAASFCLWLLLRELGLGRAPAALALVLATVAFQLRPQDPILAYAGLEQWVFGQIAISLLFFNRWLRLGQRKHLVLALVLFVTCSLTYESSYVFGPLYAILALNQRRQIIPALKVLIPVIVLSLIFLAIGSYGRSHASTDALGTAYAPSFNLHELMYTLGDQMVGALPLTYALFDPLRQFTPFSSVVVRSLGTGDVALGLLFALATAALAVALRRKQDWSPLLIVALGAALWLLTAGPIALATRYQQQITAGLAHIPVILECFALGMVVVGLVAAAARHSSPALRVGGVAVLAVLVGATAALGHRVNAITVASLQPQRTVGRTVEQAASTVVRDRVAEGSTLYVDPNDGVNSANFFRIYTDKKYNVIQADPAKNAEAAQTGGACTAQRPGVWWLRSAPLTPQTGYAVLSCAGGPGADLVLFHIPASRVAVSALSAPGDSRHAPNGVFGLASRVRLDQLAQAIDPYGVTVSFVGSRAVMADWTRGCWATETNQRGVGRWCEGDAEVTVISTTGRAEHSQVRLPVIAFGDGAKRVVVTGPNGLHVDMPAGQITPFPVDVPAGTPVHLHVHVRGARRLPDAGAKAARMFVWPAPEVL